MQWNPFKDMESLFDSELGFGQRGEAWMPRVDISESDDEYLISADLAGVDKSDIKLSVDNNILSLEGERRSETCDDKVKPHRTERFYGSFARRFTLPPDANTKEIRADAKDGVLQVHVPRQALQRPQTQAIPIQ
jgi:HSP20 family protein